jgi:sec-independent protein translocase protein TatA
MFRDISAWHLGLILLAFVVLFGYKKLPDATRSLGRSMRIFRSEVKSMHDDEPKQVETPRAEPPAQNRTEVVDSGQVNEPRTESERS